MLSKRIALRIGALVRRNELSVQILIAHRRLNAARQDGSDLQGLAGNRKLKFTCGFNGRLRQPRSKPSIYFVVPGGIEMFAAFEDDTGALPTKTFSTVSEDIFSWTARPESGEPVAGGQGLSSRVVLTFRLPRENCREIQGGGVYQTEQGPNNVADRAEHVSD